MKTSLVTLGLLFFSPLFSNASILPTRTIIQKTVESAGSGIFAIEQEVQFANGEETINLKETWLIDSDRTMRLTVTGGKELQNTFKLQFLYTGGQKWSLNNAGKKNEKIPDEFLEKYLNFRNADVFANQLVHHRMIPSNAMTKKPLVKVGNDYKRDPEPWVRLSRTGGVVNYALGAPSSSDKEDGSPGIWIEQNQFVIRKLRLPSQAEMHANNYNQFAKGLQYPRTRTIRWDNNTVTIRLISASARPQTAVSLLQPGSMDTSTNWDRLANLPAKEVITEFYTRFR